MFVDCLPHSRHKGGTPSNLMYGSITISEAKQKKQNTRCSNEHVRSSNEHLVQHAFQSILKKQRQVISARTSNPNARTSTFFSMHSNLCFLIQQQQLTNARTRSPGTRTSTLPSQNPELILKHVAAIFQSILHDTYSLALSKP